MRSRRPGPVEARRRYREGAVGMSRRAALLTRSVTASDRGPLGVREDARLSTGYGPRLQRRRLGKDAGDVAHLAVRADFELAVEMEGEVWLGEDVAPFLGVLADQVVHFGPAAPGRGAERPAGDGADMLLELRGLGALDRPVAGIVHPRRDLVDDKPLVAVPVADDEHLDRQHAD